MDLGAWLWPGGVWLTSLEGPGQSLLVERLGRPLWFCSEPRRVGQRLLITVELPNFSLDHEHCLVPAPPPESVTLKLVGKVQACRGLHPCIYVIHLNLLGRVIT